MQRSLMLRGLLRFGMGNCLVGVAGRRFVRLACFGRVRVMTCHFFVGFGQRNENR